MTTYTTLSDTSLAQDKPLTQSIARAFRDNPLAIGEGDASAPRSSSKSISSQYFKARRTTNQAHSGTSAAKLSLNTEIYDPDGVFDAATNYRFTPTVPGLYLVGLKVTSSDMNLAGSLTASIGKNGSGQADAFDHQTTDDLPLCVVLTTIVQMNGSTDYIEGFFSQNASVSAYNVQGEMYAVGLCEA